jgi:radical SAM superfamily enzyme YgiQ (UPF0313 family)
MEERSFELGPIRPPSEAYSLLIRTTRNCPWNRCKFCHTYKGEKFELRSVDEIKQDILSAKAIYNHIRELAAQPGFDGNVKEAANVLLNNAPDQAYYNVALWTHAGGETVFLQDGNSLIMSTADLFDIIKFLKDTFPSIKRITSYARSKTVANKSLQELVDLHEAGLTRLHLGLESGYDPLLEYMEKGVTAAEHIEAGKNVVASGISLCEYVILGLGGERWWREHATETARVLSEINPHFIRVRTLAINHKMPLYQEIEDGRFVRANDERIVEEERHLVEGLTCTSHYVSDHVTNLLQELEGKFPEDKQRLLDAIEVFQCLAPTERANFIAGRRFGVYHRLNDMDDFLKHQQVKEIIQKFGRGNDYLDDQTIARIMERFI